MKKGILLVGVGDSNWIGGLYYIKNVAFSLLQNENIIKNHRIYIFLKKDNFDIFKAFSENKNVRFIFSSNNKLLDKIKLLLCVYFKNIKVIYPKHKKIPSVTCVEWIPDFQHIHLPEYFSEEENDSRTNGYIKLLKDNNPLMLSSNDALKDLSENFIVGNKKVYVLHFVSYIEDVINTIDAKYEDDVLNKFQLANCRFAVIMNQFWQHKNHLVVFKAIKELSLAYPDDDLVFVFSGKLNDYRAPDYISKIKEAIEDPIIKDRIKMLGFIDRREQIALMKRSQFVIQPSLFEGWGTVLEDAKVLDKTVLLSDISIHREQKNNNCILFNPYDEKELAEHIYKIKDVARVESVENGLKEMYRSAEEYSRAFEKMILESKK